MLDIHIVYWLDIYNVNTNLHRFHYTNNFTVGIEVNAKFDAIDQRHTAKEQNIHELASHD